MHYSGNAFTTTELDDSDAGKIVRVDFDAKGSSVNVFNDAAFEELNQVLDLLECDSNVGGLVFTSSKDVFVAGADIGVLLDNAKSKSMEEFMNFISYGQRTFDRIQGLPFATAAAINGVTLGGGLEFTLAMDVRVLALRARIGLPEVGLGVFPGWGGTVRLPRMIDPLTAAEWIAYGKPQRADRVLNTGLVAAITTREDVLKNTVAQLKNVQLSYTQIRIAKSQPIKLTPQLKDSLTDLLTHLARKPGKNYPAATAAVKSILSQAPLPAHQANRIETRDFSSIIKSDTAINLLSVFMNDQAGRAIKRHARGARKIKSLAVIGAGKMGSSIAHHAALRKVPTVLTDIEREALQSAMDRAGKGFDRLVERGQLDAAAKEVCIRKIKPVIENANISPVKFVLETVDEDAVVKKYVLEQLEGRVRPETVICTGTATLSINQLAVNLKRPDKFCGMHFIDPAVTLPMPLIEVVRGKSTSSDTVAQAVGLALQLGKKPIVVDDGPSFLVNRILYAYLVANLRLISEGVDFHYIDRIMSEWGWSTGPAHFCDVIGMDTVVDTLDSLADEITSRMSLDFLSACHILRQSRRFGQKNGFGFYQYERNEVGRMSKQDDHLVSDLLYADSSKVITPEEIEDRLMIALSLEAVRCLQEGIVASAAELDMALLWGLAFPKFRGGAIRYIDTRGVEEFCIAADGYTHLGPQYHLPELLLEKLASGQPFY